MIGLFDSGHGGLTVLRALVERFPQVQFAYLGDHANVPYGNRASDEIVELTRVSVETLFKQGCRLVILACNTATAVAARTLQQDWLPGAGWSGYNVLGIVAPTVEAATQTPWAVTTPQYPQKYRADTIGVFATQRTVQSNVYLEEIRKRCPRVEVIQQACPDLVRAIEAAASEAEIDQMVRGYVLEMLARVATPPHDVILGCTHFPLVEASFRRHLPATTRVLSQPQIVADSLEDYLHRHSEFSRGQAVVTHPILWTTGEPEAVSRTAALFWPQIANFSHPAIAA